MTELSDAFDPDKDYMEELTPSEKWEESGKEYPYLKGLKRLSHRFRGGLQGVESRIVKVPSLEHDGTEKSVPDCIAAVTVRLIFKDGTFFEGSADASFKAHKAPFNKHLVATAESKAEARAIRRAFNITQVAKEEMGAEEEEESNGPITDVQIEGIKKIAKRKGLSPDDVLGLIGHTDGDLKRLTRAEGISALKAVNKHKPKKEKEPKEE